VTTNNNEVNLLDATDFEVGPSAISAYSRLNYVMWYALAEFVDNSTQSRSNYGGIIDDVLAAESVPLRVDITYDRQNRVLTIRDNSIGMTRDKLVAALKIARPTPDSKGRSKYGMGLKTAACWIGNKWSVTTCQWDSGEEWTATVDVPAIIGGNAKIPLTSRAVDKSHHYTEIKMWDLNRHIQKRTEETIMTYLGAMYRMDIRTKRLLLLFNGNPVPLPENREIAKYDDGTEAKESFQTTIAGHPVHGWFGVLLDGGRKYGGFSLIQHDRQIRGYPDAWKPRAVFGGVDDEGGNSLVAQRLIGEIMVDGFDVSHTKDAILFRGTEEEELEKYLAEKTQKLKAFATSMRKGQRGTPWSRERVAELLEGMKQEFSSSEIKDVVTEAVLPPLSVIVDTNKKQIAALEPGDMLWSLEVGAGITVRVFLQDRSANDPHLTIASETGNVLSVIINQQHPYYLEIDSTERADELIRQYIYDAVAEYRVFQRIAVQQPDAIRRFKDQLLRAKITRLHNQHSESTQTEFAKLSDDLGNNDAAQKTSP
jgi:Histidine kinase-, DNA gyrase B-, and HSP90-like ATPase